MIRFIITDLDGTLFHNHGESLFDLTSENVEGLKQAKENGICVLPCSGRAITYTLRLYELHDLGTPVIAAGLNAATIYDEGLVEIYKLDKDIVLKMMDLVNEYPGKFYNMQVQDEWETRYYSDLLAAPATTYRNATGKDKCTVVGDIDALEYVNSGRDICRFSIISHTASDSKFLEEKLREVFDDEITISRSSNTFIEVNHKIGNKARFVRYIKEKYNLTADEVAVIGDNHNDSFMFTESNHTFAMQSGDELLKNDAKYIVESVAECINMCLEMNENN